MNVLVGFKETFNDLLKESEKTLDEIAADLHTSKSVISKWKNHTKDLKMKSLIKLADYFNCSVEFLCGNSRDQLNYTPKECPPFCTYIKTVLASCKVSAYKLVKNTSISRAQFHRWSKGTEPLLTSLETVAEFLDITLDCLIGRDR